MNVAPTLRATLSAMLLVSTSTVAFAHATLEVKQVAAKASYKAVMRVGHGCEGTATLKVRIQVPEGYINVKPMPKAGWTMETVTGKYGKEYDTGHARISQGVKEVIWTGKLLDAHYDEFVLTGTIDGGIAPNTMLWFPTVQECEKGFNRWIEIPAAGKSPGDYKEPAPGLRVVAPN